MGAAAATTRVSRKREKTRGELVAAAERLVAARGLDALSIDEITAAADVAKGTFYTHFADICEPDFFAGSGLRCCWKPTARPSVENATPHTPAPGPRTTPCGRLVGTSQRMRAWLSPPAVANRFGSVG